MLFMFHSNAKFVAFVRAMNDWSLPLKLHLRKHIVLQHLAISFPCMHIWFQTHVVNILAYNYGQWF